MLPSPVAPDVDVLVVGAGIAGACAAYFANAAGRRVTIVDDGAHRASGLPIALVNPLRGHDGRLIAGGVEAMDATFALVDDLRAAGHPVDGARGLFRPLLDVAPEARERAFWTRKLDGRLAFAWHDAAPSSLGLVDRVPALWLPDAGWVAPASLLRALLAASRATVVRGRVASFGDAGTTATLTDGTPLTARTVLWCAGAWGAALTDAAAASVGGDGRRGGGPPPASSPPASSDRPPEPHARPAASYKPGSLLASAVPLTREPMSFGLYAAPWRDADAADAIAATLIGPTREGSHSSFPDGPLPIDAVRHLGDRVARTFGATIGLREVWRGVRLARLSPAASAALAGVPTLTALGSRGFLMAPLLASRWARSL